MLDIKSIKDYQRIDKINSEGYYHNSMFCKCKVFNQVKAILSTTIKRRQFGLKRDLNIKEEKEDVLNTKKKRM